MKTLLRLAIPFLTGLIFALGLCLSGMTDTSKVQGFLDIMGAWDPSLMFVMIGAIGVHALAYALWIKKRSKPYLEASFQLPQQTTLDKRLLFGAAIFGIGWGLAGFCPGPALVSLVSLQGNVWIFVAAMISGMTLFELSAKKTG